VTGEGSYIGLDVDVSEVDESQGSERLFDGTIGNVRLFDHPLTEDEVRQLMYEVEDG